MGLLVSPCIISVSFKSFLSFFFEGNWTTMNFWSPQKMLHSILFLFKMQREDQRLQCKKYGSQVKSVNALPLFKTLIPAFLALALFHSESNPFHLAATFIAKFLQHAICRYWFLQSKGQLGEPFLDRALCTEGHSHILFPIIKTCPPKNNNIYANTIFNLWSVAPPYVKYFLERFLWHRMEM